MRMKMDKKRELLKLRAEELEVREQIAQGRLDSKRGSDGKMIVAPLDFANAPSRLYDIAKEYETLGRPKKAEACYRLSTKLAKEIYSERTRTDSYLREIGNYSRGRVNELRAERMRRVGAVVAMIGGILGGLFFLSTNITGNAISDMTTKTTSFLGAGLIIIGLVAGFFWMKSKKN